MCAYISQRNIGRNLIKWGVLLFLLGLVTGFFVPLLANPRMALSSHLEGLLNGMFLIILGLLWHRLRLSRSASEVAFRLALYGTYVNWATTLAAAIMNAGASMMPMASLGKKGSPIQELIINFGLVSLSLAIIACCGMILWGLRGEDPQNPDELG
jgi:hydroxylaminobenzene mutase